MGLVNVEGRGAADYDLAQAAAAGDAGAFEALYRRHFRKVYGLCLRMSKNLLLIRRAESAPAAG